MTPQRVAILVVLATLGLLVLLLLLYGRPRRTRQEPMPVNFAAGDPDSVLEGSRLHSVQVWGLASAIFITGFLVVYFVVEPFREASYAERFLEASVERGEHEYKPDIAAGESGANCAQCHGPDGSGGFAATDTSWPAPPLNNVFYRYTEQEVTRIIAMGRPGTPMPTWGIEFGGALNDQKIEDVVNFLKTIQVPDDERWELPAEPTDGRGVYDQKCAVCHGPDAGGQGMGQPLPTFFAPDLTTEFYRLGLKVMNERLTLQFEIANDKAPTAEELQTALDATPTADIMAAGEEAARNTIEQGRQNTPMPAWRNRILPEQIDAVLAYLESIQTVPAGSGRG
jgi:mono/diheme cytochrome c family protein